MVYRQVIFALLVLCVSKGQTIECISCNSLTDKQCSETPRSSPTITCSMETISENATWILKYIQDYKIKVNGFVCIKTVRNAADKSAVFRGCVFAAVERLNYCKQLQEENLHGKLKFCETCDTNLCNGSSDLAPLAALLLVAPLVTLTSAQS